MEYISVLTAGTVFTVNSGGADLGNPTTDYAEGTFGNQVYSRNFENGIVIVNHNASAVEINFASLYKDVTSQIQSITFSIPEYDGRIFIQLE